MLFFFAVSMYICAAAASVIQITGANTMRFCKPQGHTINHGAQILRIALLSLIAFTFTYVLCSHPSSGFSIQFEHPYYPVMEGGTATVNVVLSNPYDTAFLVIIMPERTGGETATPFCSS